MRILTGLINAYRRSGPFAVWCRLEDRLGIRLPLSAHTRWRLGFESEISFWDDYFRTKGLSWPEEYKVRLNPDSVLQDPVATFLPPGKSEVRILDVGAGPLTFLGKKHPSAVLKITAVDPLADEYDKILKKYAVVPPVRTERLEAEKLTSRFEANSFDLVFARNCIDHSFSPETAVLQMLEVVKKGCHVLMVHRQNEAVAEHYEGLHQWNLSTESGDFIISSRKEKLNFTRKYAAACRVECRVDSEDWLHTSLLKQ